MRLGLPEFGLEIRRSRLFRDGEEVDLEPKVFDLLCYFIANPRRLITKSELRREVWQLQRLGDAVIANAVAKLRRALGQAAEADTLVETLRGRGYIFHLPQVTSADAHEAARAAAFTTNELDPFVGRAAALDNLTKKQERARSDGAGLVLVCGPAGIGKTRLVKELMRRAARDGTSAWLGAAYEGEGFPPYWPWMQVIREAQCTAPSAFARALPKGPHLLSHWVSGLGPLPAAGEAVDPQAVRFRLFDELTHCLRALASDGPKLVVIDDLQRADAGSIDLLRHATRALGTSPVLFVATMRDDEALSRNVEEAVSRLNRVASRVRLTGLTQEESRTLAHSLRGSDPPSEAQLRELFERSEGNPFFIRQFLEWWTEVGTDRAHRDELPPGAREMVRRRLTLLPAEARRVLAAASVLGMRFRASRLSRMLDESSDSVIAALTVASRLTLVTRIPGTDELTFTHPLLQETLYQDSGLQTRGALHGRAADSFEAEADGTAASHLADRARHLVHALPSRLEEAVEACEGAARAAQQSAGFERASDLLALALTKLEVEGGSPEEQARLWTDLADNHFFAAELDVAWHAYRRAAELLLTAGSSERLARLAAPLVRCVNQGAGDAEFARALVDEILRTLPPNALRERRCTLAKKAQLALELSADERTAMLDEAARSVDDPWVRLEVAYARNMMREPSTLDRNAQAAEEFLAVIEEGDQDPSALRYRTLHRLGVHITRYVCAVTAGDLGSAEQTQAAIAQLAETSHLRAAEVVLAMIRAGRALADGRLDDLAAVIEGSVAPSNDTFAITEARRSYQLLLLEARGAMALLEKVELPPLPEGSIGTLRYRTDLAIAHAYLYARTARPERARDMLERIPRRDIERMPVLYGDLGVLTGLSRIYAELGDESGMRLAYEKLLPFAGRNALMPTFAFRGAVDHFLGLLAQRLGDTGRARAHLLAAVDMNRRLRMPRQVSESEALLASLV